MRYSTLTAPLDVEGKALFSATAWSRGRSLRVVARRQFSARDLLDNALSYPSSLEAILRDKDDFERELENVLAPHYRSSNNAVGEILNWGLEYRRA